MHRRNQPLGIALVVLSALCLIQNAGVSRVVLRAGLSPALLTTSRVTFTFLVLLVLAMLFRRTALVPPRGRLLLLLVLHGSVGVAALQWTYFVAIDRLTVSMALLLEYQAPVLVALWARLVQKEATHPRLWLGLALAVFGLAAGDRGLERRKLRHGRGPGRNRSGPHVLGVLPDRRGRRGRPRRRCE